MGKKRHVPSESSSSSYDSSEYSDSSESTTVSTAISKNKSKISKASKPQSNVSSNNSDTSTYVSKASVHTNKTLKNKTEISSTDPSSVTYEKSVVALSEAPPSVFEENSKKDKHNVAPSTVASSAMPVKEAPTTSNLAIAEGGGWSIWNNIITQKISEKNSIPGYLKRTLYAVKDSYIAILIGMITVFIVLVSLRPSFVLGTSTSRYEDPPLDLVRVCVFTAIFGTISFTAINFVSKTP